MAPSPTASLPVPFFSQLDPSDGPEGWRQCQTSSIAMALAYLGVPGIADDTDYLAIVRRIGDTTAAETHRRALASLKVPTTFRQNMGVDDAKACLLRRRPVVIGLLHRGPVTRPSGGGHYIILTGFDTRGWLVHDLYGEIDLVAGGWVRTGSGSGRSQHYSFRNTNPRWLVEGPRSGWGWTFP